MRERILAALVGLLIILPALVFGGTWGAEIIIGLVLLIGLDEYAGMAFPGNKARALGALVPASVVLYVAVLYGPPGAVTAAAVAVPIFLALSVLFRPEPVDTAADAFGRLVLGVVWIPMLFVFLALLRRLEHGMSWVFFTLAVTWLGDTGGYFGGRFFGKNKLYPKISPKKTWEGVVGGLIFAAIAGCVVKYFGLPELGWVECVVLALVLDAFGVLGDLIESMLKRSFDVKDSGWIMPGHGGILDRIDGVLFTAPLLYAWIALAHGV